ncbi:TetR/AcrR family transcriptional regulator [Nocardia sp. CDC159]|uniref:TetR/AcrR family transcriptional regulator n=1 Tax=Nocardia pulmonis TaxID=2951408 RepID=A0A9X2IVE9_9NOCA|nr:MULTISPECIES: TetR/AcrR family transcriptional regulator [Nocardia]MCM6773153.1 TetR/AcrR family transcriptional regulator [Nocardia pulmonis]MCM6785544.1 TetR/AcrR family transcriptional regulator [Nocardia sp. CDC159]
MPVGPGATIDPEATRARVLDAAARLFYERSLTAVGMREIATASNASPLTIYRYFESKEGLAAAVVRERSDRIHAWLRAGLAEAPAGRGRVLALFDLLARWFAEQGFHGCPVLNYVADSRGGQSARDLTRQHLARYRQLLEQLLREAGVAAPPPLARQLLLLIEGAVVVTQIDGDGTAAADARAAAAALLDAALPGERPA